VLLTSGYASLQSLPEREIIGLLKHDTPIAYEGANYFERRKIQ
jgi:hypothetical protein